MSGFTDRVEQNLQQIADRAAPSSNAWEAFQTRIANQEDQPEMELIVLDENRTPKIRSNAWIVAAAAAALIAIGALAVALRDEPQVISNDPDPAQTTITQPEKEPSTVPPTSESAIDTEGVAAAEAIGLDFMQARNDYDGALQLSMLAPDVSTGGAEFANTADEYLLQAQWEQAVGWQFLQPECRAGTPERVVCTYNLQDSINLASGGEPVPGNSFLLEVTDGQIVGVTHNYNAVQSVAGMAMAAWVQENYPGDIQKMMAGTALGGDAPARLTSESIALWESHTAEFITTLE